MIRGTPAGFTAEKLIAGGVPFVEATVVRAQSPTSVRPGDAAIVRPDGTIEGFVGGACAEASVRLQALRALETGEAMLLRILPGEDERQAAEDEGAVTVKNPCLSGGALEIFLEPHLPAATIRVVGNTPIALALADLGKRVGYAVELRAPEDGEPAAGDAAVVVASHGHEEERILTSALQEGVPYVGLVASRIRGEAIRESLDLPGELRSQLHTPAGLRIGARTPEEIALSILAEIVSLQRSAGVGPVLAPAVPAPVVESAPPDDPVQTPPPDPPAETQPQPLATTAVAIDPVCGMEVAVSPASIQLERSGERHYFCSEGCRDAFAAEGAPDAGVR